MSTEEYRYVDGKAAKSPIWGTEIAMDKQRITVTTARFDPSEQWKTGMLAGNRTIWKIDDDLMKAKVVGIQHWTAETGNWSDYERAVPFRHRSVLANFLMGRWNKGKLRGRINDKL